MFDLVCLSGCFFASFFFAVLPSVGLLDFLSNAFSQLFSFLKEFFDGLISFLKGCVDWVLGILKGFFQAD